MSATESLNETTGAHAVAKKLRSLVQIMKDERGTSTVDSDIDGVAEFVLYLTSGKYVIMVSEVDA